MGTTEILSGRSLNVLADSSKGFEVEMCHIFGEDIITFLVKTLWPILFSSAISSRLTPGDSSQTVALL